MLKQARAIPDQCIGPVNKVDYATTLMFRAQRVDKTCTWTKDANALRYTFV